jgi:hypothetical protein
MKDKQIKKLVRKQMEWWVHWMGLGYGKVDILWEEVIEWEDGHFDTQACCTCDWKYQISTIVFALSKLRVLKKREIEEVCVHELCHIFLNEMREDGIHHEERCATQLQKAFMWVRDADK